MNGREKRSERGEFCVIRNEVFYDTKKVLVLNKPSSYMDIKKRVQ